MDTFAYEHVRSKFGRIHDVAIGKCCLWKCSTGQRLPFFTLVRAHCSGRSRFRGLTFNPPDSQHYPTGHGPQGENVAVRVT